MSVQTDYYIPEMKKMEAIISSMAAEITKLRAERDAAALGIQERWPAREVVAREIRRAMLDNPTDDSFNKRAEKREAIADATAQVICARFEYARDGHATALLATEGTGQ